jgi:class 3 adenylate cyclase
MRLDEGDTPDPLHAAGDRRLAAIMFTDMVGFTTLTQRDEAGALRLLEEHRALVRPILARRKGREVKTIGDGFMIEFASAVESVECALEIQAAVARRNSSRPSMEKILLRVGIHVGDVIREGNDLVGDGVNVASRIEPLATPGGICITGPVWDQIRNKVNVRVEKIPDPHLKNVSIPVDVYQVAG